MRARHIPTADLEVLLDPEAPGWKRVGTEPLKLEGTQVGMQPSRHVRAAWTGRHIGAIERVGVAAVHDGRLLAFRLEWSNPTKNRDPSDNHRFLDAAAVVLPAAPRSPVFTMGAPGLAVNAWYWRADEERARNVVAEGLGTSRTVDVERVRAHGTWREGLWRVVIARALRVDTAEPVAQLEPGGSTGFGVAVWDGGSGERAGIKSFSGPTWHELQLDALPTTRR
jgi:DMSO reductase family type II enzyme heme b subunit